MITPRRIRLLRVVDLAACRALLTSAIAEIAADLARDTCVLVPTAAAGEQLRRTAEDRLLDSTRPAMLWPVVCTRHDLYAELAARLAERPVMLSAFEREVVLAAICRKLTDEGLELAFQIRPGLVAEMLALYDHIRRLGRTVDDFVRNFSAELAREQDTDRGAARLMEQTVFLGEAYRAYESRLAFAERADEHVLRSRLLEGALASPLRRIIVTVGDYLADPDGVWPADLDLLARLPGLDILDVVATEAMLAAGLLERLYAAFPDLEEVRPPLPPSPAPHLVVQPSAAGGAETLCFSYRDREEELAGVARRLKQERREGTAASLVRTALVVQRPLPYLYLARAVFDDAAIAFEAVDTLPLAAEPFAAALDLALDAVAADFTRGSIVAMLRSPHLALAPGPHTAGNPRAVEGTRFADAVAACEYALADARYLGGLDRLEALVARWEAREAPASRQERRQARAVPAARAVLDAARALAPLTEPRPLTEQITTLIDWMARYDRPPAAEDPTRARRLRVRGAILGALMALRRAYDAHDPDFVGDVTTLTATIRRWLGSQTFAVPTGAPGLRILDAQAARFADLDDMQLVGLIEGEWPGRVRRNVLYPSSLLLMLEPLPAVADPGQREREALRAARAGFRDLVRSPASRVRLSTFSLEQDAVVEPSMLLDEVAALGLPKVVASDEPLRVGYAEALYDEPRRADVLPGVAHEWGALRLDRDGRAPQRLRGAAGPWVLPRVSVSRLELYLNCPFKFFAAQVLKLEEPPQDESIQTPLERGLLLHELWERFFAEWQRRGHARIAPQHLPEARALFAELCEAALSRLSPAEAALERTRLLGSAVDPGIAHRVFAMEATRPAPIVERLLEYPLAGDFTFTAHDGETRRVAINAKTDRVDVLEGGALRVIDYKSRYTPDPKVALQLPIYARLAAESLQRARGGQWTLAEALYVSFEGDRAVVPLRPARGETLAQLIEGAEDRLLKTLDDIAAGAFPPRPQKKSLCGPCAYRSVCRLELVADEAPEPSAEESVAAGDE